LDRIEHNGLKPLDAAGRSDAGELAAWLRGIGVDDYRLSRTARDLGRTTQPGVVAEIFGTAGRAARAESR